MAYNLSEQVEEHAYAFYDDFLKKNEEELKQTPACGVAVSYFQLGDLYLFDEFQTNVYDGLNKATNEEVRRPKIKTMYDVIENVRNDELEHVKTMNFCQKPGNLLRANSSIRAQRKAREICDGIVENDGGGGGGRAGGVRFSRRFGTGREGEGGRSRAAFWIAS